ncbi:hypothetical protein G7Y89_g8965 [Cudoniella acicularis]|uniref:Beta-xylosidase C-terminal Concanavalin A-like domain-containing protein n=1 Tax=Cudoniella acicularis TaxID=354080 RepID=A0A8H4RJA7_9HELO|nr:hypothetical protein G7Y89_g8965 [Cudoniella acicularis]
MRFTNPIISGFAPDPSVVFVDGNAINRPNQLSLEHANIDGFPLGNGTTLIAAQGLLAPSIRWYKGVFYVICTNSWSDGTNLNMKNFYVSTTDIWSDKWSDPIAFDFQRIDPSLFFDEDGPAYIQGSWRAGPVYDPQCTIRQLEIDIKTGTPLSETKEIWEGFAGKDDAEGPHIYKKDGYYFLIAAEAGTFEHHMITVARSRGIWGPYESYEKNPILTAFDKDMEVQHTGHGDIFQGGNGACFLAQGWMYKEDFRHCEVFYHFSTSSVCFKVVNKLKAEPKLLGLEKLLSWAGTNSELKTPSWVIDLLSMFERSHMHFLKTETYFSIVGSKSTLSNVTELSLSSNMSRYTRTEEDPDNEYNDYSVFEDPETSRA